MAHPDLDQLWNSIVPVAQMLLTKQGELLPIGAIMLSDGVIRHVAGNIEGDDYPASQSLLDLLTDTFRTQVAKGNLRAAAICYDVLTIPPGKDRKQDAICCGLEHCLGESVDVFTPYVKTEDGGFHYKEAFCAKRNPQFFFKMPRA